MVAALVSDRQLATAGEVRSPPQVEELEATFDHGETDGYGLWLDASVKDNPVYAEHWAGKSDVTVHIEADQIVIRRAGSPAPGGEESDSESESDDE